MSYTNDFVELFTADGSTADTVASTTSSAQTTTGATGQKAPQQALRLKIPSTGRVSKPLTKLSDADVLLLAHDLLSNKKNTDLKALRRACGIDRPALGLSDQEILNVVADEHRLLEIGTSRTTELDKLSEGESENDDPTIVYRALRPDEADPYVHGLKPPDVNDPAVTLGKHVGGGTDLAVKANFISMSRSKKVAAWSFESRKEGRLAKIRLPIEPRTADNGEEDFEYPKRTDLTDPRWRSEYPKLGLGDTTYNFALSSQEVVHRGPIPSTQIIEVLKTKKLLVRDYQKAKADNVEGVTLLRARARKAKPAVPISLELIPRPGGGQAPSGNSNSTVPIQAAASTAQPRSDQSTFAAAATIDEASSGHSSDDPGPRRKKPRTRGASMEHPYDGDSESGGENST